MPYHKFDYSIGISNNNDADLSGNFILCSLLFSDSHINALRQLYLVLEKQLRIQNFYIFSMKNLQRPTATK